jgi:hypothetical protein
MQLSRSPIGQTGRPAARLTAAGIATAMVAVLPATGAFADPEEIDALLPPVALAAATGDMRATAALEAAPLGTTAVCTGPMLGRDARSDAAPVRVTAQRFDPILVERIGGPADDAAAQDADSAGKGGNLLTALAELDPEALRVLATMSPDQIDALTLLVLSRNGGPGAAGGALAPQAAAADAGIVPADAPWVGDWSNEEIEGDGMAAAARDLPTDWRVVEYADGQIELQSPIDPVTSLTVEAGLVLGGYGRVTDVVRGPEQVQVILDTGAVLTGAANPARALRPDIRPSVEKATILMASHGGREKIERLQAASAAGPMIVAAAMPVQRGEDGAPPPRPPLATANLLPGKSDPDAGNPADADPGMVVAATFASEAGATDLSRELVEFEMVPVVETAQDGGRTVFRVLVDPYQTAISPERIAERLSQLGYGADDGAAGTGATD